MKQHYLFFIAALITLNTFSQTSFQNGYIINNLNEKISCLIENRDWNNNPTDFKYKLSENSEILTGNLQTVQEFGIDNTSKYVRSNVNIDRSPSNINNLSDTKAPLFEKEDLFLNVLVDGKAVLYSYEGIRLKRYFISVDNSPIEQLVYKEYTNFDRTEIGKNTHYKQQIFNALSCPKITPGQIESLEYKKNDLVAVFLAYNSCDDSQMTNYVEKRKRDLININLRPRANSASLETEAPVNSSDKIQLDTQTSFGFGVEFEYILPFNNDSWSLSIEPTYQSYKSDGFNTYDVVSGEILYASIDYKSIEIPITARHYFFQNKSSKFYLNAAFLIDISLDSTIEYNRDNGSNLDTLEINSGNSYAFGLGYKYNNKYSLEIRYQTNRDLLGNFPSLTSDYTSTSIIFGYTIF